MKISAVVPDELVGALERRARAEDRSLSAEVRRALAAYLSPRVGGTPAGNRGPGNPGSRAAAERDYQEQA